MSRTRRVEGRCHLCGNQGPLSFEHVPPRAAFNRYPVVMAGIHDALASMDGEPLRGEIQQRGMGGHTLCEKCNNQTGAWYGGHYASWCQQCIDLLQQKAGEHPTSHTFHLRPLAVLKQIVVMFASACGDGFHGNHAELAEFALDRDSTALPSKYRFFAYLFIQGAFRFHGPMGILDLRRGAEVFAGEITFLPVGLVMTINSPPPDSRLYEITGFSSTPYDEVRDVDMNLAVLPVLTPWVGDYRTEIEIRNDAGE